MEDVVEGGGGGARGRRRSKHHPLCRFGGCHRSDEQFIEAADRVCSP